MIHKDRQRGMLLGLAIGDALGAAVEFELPGSFEPVIGYRGGGPHGLEPGEWTDDTSMALALADSIAEPAVSRFSISVVSEKTRSCLCMPATRL
jgi:ADP-ribosylglycohydrolase